MRFEQRAVLRFLPLLVLGATHASAQIPYRVFDDDTEVHSVRFLFPETRTFDDARLEQEIGLRGRGAFYGIRNTLSFLPLVPDPIVHLFRPLDLQYDVARLRRFYAESGFLETDIRYAVRYRAEQNAVDVDLVITEGRPILLRVVDVVEAGGTDPLSPLPEKTRDGWEEVKARVEADTGGRLTLADQLRQETAILAWWKNRGWAFASLQSQVAIDSTDAVARLRLTLTPGPRARIGRITIDGGESVSRDLILRALPFKEGDWFANDRLAEGERRLFALELFRLVLVDLVPESPPDSLAHIRVRIQESPARLVTGELGYVSGAGVTTSGEFAHRNFLGGARTLQLGALAETGFLGTSAIPDREFRASLTYRQPWFLHPLLTLSLSPFGQYRDDVTDRSWQFGFETALLYQLGPDRAVSFSHRYSRGRILDYRLGSGSSIDLATLIELIATGAFDSVGRTIDRSTLGLTGVIGRYDPTRPASAIQGRPAVEVTVPAGLNTIEYLSLDLPVIAYQPLGGRLALFGRFRVGRVFPFGKTTAGEGPSLLDLIQLRQVQLTAGGTSSVRGWGEALLGPKFVNLSFTRTDVPDSLLLSVNGYAPRGGLLRASGSVELQMPFPGLGESWGTHIFLDAGRVWTTEERFAGTDPYDEQRWFFGAGAGFQIGTIIGPIRFSAGWKLNPSALDLRDPEAVFGALLQDLPVSSVPTSWKHRLHLHLSLGQVY